MTIKVDMRGLDDVRSTLGRQAAARLRRAIDDDVEQGVRDMAETSYEYAPVETGELRNSILASVKRENLMEYIYGSTVPYAQRQEYEHKTKKAYFRRSIAEHTPEIKSKIQSTIRRRLS